ncbi:uncharacterized protein LOC136039297 [Artemia franciscana]|uniref:Uncharacterized protein n=1 Tax=Artemia franciscana TaxID=6661 RepID=A0AA88HYL3_ARTSF|nr:hypothetical protein QYM36_006851 [Artemia franciscana]
MSCKSLSFSLLSYKKPVLVTNNFCEGSTSTGKTDESGLICQETLNSILRPRTWIDDEGAAWMQEVSSTPGSRTDVIALRERLNYKLRQRQSRPVGFCPIRRELYSQCFDELIRQTSINCSESGLLLVEVRDEISTSMNALIQLYESAVAYTVSKDLKFQKDEEGVKNNIDDLKNKIQGLETELKSLHIQFEREKEEMEEKFKLKEGELLSQIESLENTNKTIKATLQSLLTPSSKQEEF